jgi:hypothetical protein
MIKIIPETSFVLNFTAFYYVGLDRS